MLAELAVHDLGVIGDLDLVLGEGMTALTGETGAGKTLLVEAIELAVGGRAEPLLVRPGAEEARVEARFVTGDDEVVLARAVPRNGRSRAYVDGRLATVAELAERGRRLVDLHGQHAHQSLLSPRVQRRALDRFGAVDVATLARKRAELAAADAALGRLGGDSSARANELDLLRFQVAELDAAGLDDPDEDARLEREEDDLARADDHRRAGAAAYQALTAEGGAVDSVGQAIAACAGSRPFSAVEERLRAVAAEVADLAAEARSGLEGVVVDPDRLEAVRHRRRALRDLCRKYGSGGKGEPLLSQVMAYADEARARIADLERADRRRADLEAERDRLRAQVAAAAESVARDRRRAAPRLGAAVESHLHALAMPRARFEVAVEGPDPADDVTFLLAANPGGEALPLARVASGGELARAMLAARLVLTEAPPTLVFDEVDAGVGGQAALAVGRALAALADDHQVLVVTHLPQVAAFADHQITVGKHESDGRTLADARALSGRDRVVELSRMLSGQPTSAAAHGHAEELLAVASRERRR